ncbi:MAG: hypothetical protein ACI9U2_002106 [Bradymonadia bacterium]|jgi:hypothetical protein
MRSPLPRRPFAIRAAVARAIPLLAIAVVGCSSLRPIDDFAPTTHPLLTPTSANRVRAIQFDPGYIAVAEVQPPPQPGDPSGAYEPIPITNPPPAYGQQHRGLPVARRLKDLEGERRLYGQPVNDLALVKATFNGIVGIAPIDSLLAVRGRTQARRDGGAQPGDLMFFGGDQYVPAVAIVHRVIDNRTIEAAAVTRGAIRFIRVSPLDPNTRRRGGKVVNTFLRPKLPKDPPGTPHMAGQLLEDVRVLVR